MFESWFNLLISFTKINIPSLLCLVFAGLIVVIYTSYTKYKKTSRNKTEKKHSNNSSKQKTHAPAKTQQQAKPPTTTEDNTMREIKAAGIPQVNRKNRKSEHYATDSTTAVEFVEENAQPYSISSTEQTVEEIISEEITTAKEELFTPQNPNKKFFAEVKPLNQSSQTNYSPYYQVDFQNLIERKQLVKDLVNNIISEQYVYLYGEKGQGKTYLADIVSHQLSYVHEFYTVHYTCSAKNNSLQHILFNILDQHFLSSVEETLSQGVLLDILQKQVSKQKSLLIIDNVEYLALKDINLLLGLENCHVLFISNQADEPAELDIYAEEIEYINISDISRHIIHNISQTISPDNLAYVIDFVDSNIYLFNLLCRASISFSQKNIITTLEEIEKIEANSNQDKLLNYLYKHLSKDSRDILVYISLLQTDKFSLETLQQLLPRDEYNLSDSIKELLAVSLINKSSSEDSYICHELIREFILHSFNNQNIQKNFAKSLQLQTIEEIKQQEYASAKSHVIQSIENNIELCLTGEVNIHFMHYALDFIRNYNLESLAVQATEYLHQQESPKANIKRLYAYALSISAFTEKEIQHVFDELNSLVNEGDTNLDKYQTLQYLAFAYYKNYEIKEDLLSLELAIQTQEKILENQKELSTSYTVKLLIELAHYYTIKSSLVPEEEKEYSNYISLEIYKKIINTLNQSNDKIDYKLQEKLYTQMGDIVSKLNNYNYPCDEVLNNRELAINYYQQSLKYNSPEKEELYQKIAHLYWELSLTKDINKQQKQKYLQLNIASLKHLLDILIIAKSSIETDVLETITDIIAIRNNISVSYKELSQLDNKYINLELSFNYLKQALDMANEYNLDNYINIIQNQMFELYQLIRADKILASASNETNPQEQDLQELKSHIVKELANSFHE